MARKRAAATVIEALEGAAPGIVQRGEVGGEACVLEPAAVEPGVELAEGAGVGAARVLSLREALTRRRAVASGRPMAVSSDTIAASELVTVGFHPRIAVRDQNLKLVDGLQLALWIVAEPGEQGGNQALAARLGRVLWRVL